MPEWKRSLPMWLTWSRIAVCPLFFLTVRMGAPWGGTASAALFILASITDWLDGYYARLFQVESTLGQLLDPIADKILVLTVLILLIPRGSISPELVIFLLTRDLLIGGLRSVAAAERLVIAAKSAGKWKAAMQMIAIPAVLMDQTILGIPWGDIGRGVLWISVGFSLYSGWQYYQLYARASRA